MEKFLCVYKCFLLVVLVMYPIMAAVINFRKDNTSPMKGLSLPAGTVRAMLAILIIGTYLIVLTSSLWIPETEKNNLDVIISSFGSLSGAVIGFYFASRGKEGNQISSPGSENQDSSVSKPNP